MKSRKITGDLSRVYGLGGTALATGDEEIVTTSAAGDMRSMLGQPQKPRQIDRGGRKSKPILTSEGDEDWLYKLPGEKEATKGPSKNKFSFF